MKEMIVKTFTLVVGLNVFGVLLFSKSHRYSTRPKRSVQVLFKRFSTQSNDSVVDELVQKRSPVYLVNKMTKIYIPIWKKGENFGL